MENFHALFIKDVVKRLDYYRNLGTATIERLNTEQLHFKPTYESNSIAIIVQHLYGNMMSRFTNFLTEDGEKAWRKRDAEFESMALTKEDLLSFWNTGWNFALQTIEKLQPDDIFKTVYIRNEALTVMDALLRQLAHYPYHVGQIVFIGKVLLNDHWESLSIPKPPRNHSSL